MKLTTIETTKAVGEVLCHDVTKIVPGEFKGRLFKKGHIIREEDIQHKNPISLGVCHCIQ